MTIGKIYYLSTICGKLYWFLFFIKFPLFIAGGLAVAYYFDLKLDPFKDAESNVEEFKLAKKCTKWTVVSLIFTVVISLLIPNKDDFLIVAMTKNYTPEQVYTMTKEEMKSGIDYFLNQIKELKQ